MSAAQSPRNTPRMGDRSTASILALLVAGSAKVIQGTLVGINSSGYLEPASTAGSFRIVGMAEENADNTNGSNGDLKCSVRTGIFKWANTDAPDNVTALDVGENCYAIDNQTVGRSSASGMRPIAGVVVKVESDGVYVESHLGLSTAPTAQKILLTAGEDLSSVGNIAVKVNSSGQVVAAGAGEYAIGVLQNAPTSGALASVAVGGIAVAKAGTGGVTRGQQVTPESDGELITAIGSYTKTDDAGATSDALKGPCILGTALTTAAAGSEFRILVNPSGAIPTTAAVA